ncbi:SRPBCC family protein [Nocardioides marmoribigeumensis]|uniref:Uncharacterized protein YndB with AHSA1/START domain n=1 Tax=Nocardioides marmoribigeumensis TaxID=433649 RepID=A0ABU2C0L2_9ACTN|nr:SRPBCC family protein [Nocardioides marmoribigeumensis]MDR7364214.1 uncharacterized protein YndB with AHSA1/START domain [Nocardioides marmoribigeumensis]
MSDPRTGTVSDPRRELRVELEVAAPRGRVWEVLTDFSRMPAWSPELVRMVPLRRGGLRLGQQYVGINRRGPVVWPTRSVVCALAPGSLVAWDTVSSGARWIWELSDVSDGSGAAGGAGGSRTRVVHRRQVPRDLTLGSRVVAPLLLGGTPEHADELEVGMGTTLERLRAEVEGSA